jgi:hypothetical protein
MQEDQDQRQARRFYKSLGYHVDSIDVANADGKRADYLVTGFGDTILTEVKSRVPDEDYEAALEADGHALREDLLARSNSISAHIKKAARQLEQTPAPADAVRMVTLVAAGDDPEAQAAQFTATLLGVVDLLQDTGDGSESARATPCLYFDFCDFFRYPVIDAAVILADGGCRLFVNPFARPDIVRATRLYRFLDDRGAVADPVNQEAAGEVYVVDSSDLDRRDENAVLAHVRQKYSLEGPLFTFRPLKVTAAAVVRSKR